MKHTTSRNPSKPLPDPGDPKKIEKIRIFREDPDHPGIPNIPYIPYYSRTGDFNNMQPLITGGAYYPTPLWISYSRGVQPSFCPIALLRIPDSLGPPETWLVGWLVVEVKKAEGLPIFPLKGLPILYIIYSL